MCQMRRNEAESASEKVLDAKNDDEGVLEVRRGVIMKQMMPYTLAQNKEKMQAARITACILRDFKV